ncbi:MAG: TonB-dependent receptor plug domain-containing protein [Flavobacteriaceae bacterium]
MNKRVLSLLGMAFLAYTTYAQEKTQDSVTIEQLETVVLDTKFKLNREKSGKVIYTISQNDLAKVKGQSLAQTISTVSGIEITGAKSNAGSVLGYRVRGGNSRQVVILIDGIQVNDPSNINAEFDLRSLDVNNIESLEIIKGGVSTLYGTGATSGVINITTKKATDKNVDAAVFMSMGSNRSVVTDKYNLNTATVGATINGTLKKLNYLAAISTENTKGMSAKRSFDEAVTFEDDPFKRENASLRLGYKFSEAFNLGSFVNYNMFENQFDNSFGTPDGYNKAESENVQFGLTSEYTYNKGSIVLNSSIAQTDRESTSLTSKSTYASNSITIDLYNKYKFNTNFWTVIGVNVQEQKATQASTPYGSSTLVTAYNKDITKVTLVDPYANLTYFTNFGLNINAGIRMSNHTNFGSHVVYSINPSYNFKPSEKLDTKIFATGSTAFIAPTIYQQYSPDYGFKDLEAQESINGELGFELRYNKKHRFSAVVFHREDQNKIEFKNIYDTVSGWWIGGVYYNLDNDNVKTQGLELEADLKLAKKLNLTANYTLTQFEKDALSLNVPKHKANANLAYVLKENTNLSLTYQFIDDRFIYGGDRLDAYSITSFFINHQLTDNLELNGSLFNIFDEDYTETAAASTLGRNYKLGLRLTF